MRSDTAFFSAADISRRFLAGFASGLLSATAAAFVGEEARRNVERAGGGDAPRICSTSVNALISAWRRSISLWRLAIACAISLMALESSDPAMGMSTVNGTAATAAKPAAARPTGLLRSSAPRRAATTSSPRAFRRASSRPAAAEVVPPGTADRGEALSGGGGHGWFPTSGAVRESTTAFPRGIHTSTHRRLIPSGRPSPAGVGPHRGTGTAGLRLPARRARQANRALRPAIWTRAPAPGPHATQAPAGFPAGPSVRDGGHFTPHTSPTAGPRPAFASRLTRPPDSLPCPGRVYSPPWNVSIS